MGEKVAGTTKPIDAGTTTSEQPNTTNSSTTNSTAGGAGSTRKRRVGNNVTAETAKEFPSMVTIEVPLTEEQKKAEQRARRAQQARERRAKQKAEKEKVQTQSQTPVDAKQLEIILLTISSIVATRPNMDHWALSPQEVTQLADPINNILAKSESMGSLTKYSDHIALLIACVTIIIPRVIISLEKGKEKNDKPIKQATEGVNSDRRNNQKTSTYGASDSQAIFATIPVTA